MLFEAKSFAKGQNNALIQSSKLINIKIRQIKYIMGVNKVQVARPCESWVWTLIKNPWRNPDQKSLIFNLNDSHGLKGDRMKDFVKT